MTRLLRTFLASEMPRGYLRGAASIFDLRGNTCRHYSFARSADQADQEALEDDWSTVLADLGLAAELVERRITHEQQIEAGP